MAISPGLSLDIPVDLWKKLDHLEIGQHAELHGNYQKLGHTRSTEVILEARRTKEILQFTFLANGMDPVFQRTLRDQWHCQLQSLRLVSTKSDAECNDQIKNLNDPTVMKPGPAATKSPAVTVTLPLVTIKDETTAHEAVTMKQELPSAENPNKESCTETNMITEECGLTTNEDDDDDDDDHDHDDDHDDDIDVTPCAIRNIDEETLSKDVITDLSAPIKDGSKTGRKRKNNKKQLHKGKQKSRKADEDSKFLCSICGMKFSWKYTLKRHITGCEIMQRQRAEHAAEEGQEMDATLNQDQSGQTKPKRNRRQTKETHPFECSFCGRLFTRHFTQKRHLACCSKNPKNAAKEEMKASIPRYLCEFCDYKTINEAMYRRHCIETHSKTVSLENLRCKFCNRSWFLSLRIYIGHIFRCNDNPHSKVKETLSHQCQECKTGLGSQDALRRHYLRIHRMKVNIPPKRYERKIRFECQFCGKLLTARIGLMEHEKYRCPSNPDRIPAHVCPHCRRSFESQEAMEKHCSAKHVSAEAYVCDICGAVTDTYFKMYNHKLNHHQNSEPGHVCSICSRGFWTKNKLERHMEIHNEDLNYTCQICGKGFRTESYLQSHVQTFHENRYRYHCTKCGHGMQKKKYLETHICGRVRRPQKVSQGNVSSTLPGDQSK